MNCTKHLPIVFAALAGSLLSMSTVAADKDEKQKRESEVAQDKSDVEKRLQDAHRRLGQAAKDIAEINMSRFGRAPGSERWMAGPANRSTIGVVINPFTDADSKGVPVLSVSPGGGAEAAGLRSGDLITAINGKALSGKDKARGLLSELKSVEVGTKVAVTYEREGKSMTTDIETKAPARNQFGNNWNFPNEMSRAFESGFLRRSTSSLFGAVELVLLTPTLGQYFGIEKGLLVVRAPHYSQLSLQEGDVIIDIDGRVPANPGHALKILASYQVGEKVKINVMRLKKRHTVEVTIPQDDPGKHRSGFMVPPLPQFESMPGVPDIT